MSLFWTIIFLISSLNNSSQANHHHHKSPAVIVGKVYCDTCFQQNFHTSTHFLLGASVAVECKGTSSRPGFRQHVKTDNHGEFKVHLPFPISRHVNKIKGCSVRLIRSSKPYCAIAASALSSNLHIKSRKEGKDVLSAGFFTFRAFKQPQVCDQKLRIKNFERQIKRDEKSSPILNSNDPTFLPPVQDPPALGGFFPPILGGFLPPLPRLPTLPSLPSLPPLPGLPFIPPVPEKKDATKTPNLSNSAINNPNTSPFPTNPPVIFLANHSPPSFNLPHVRGLTASPPPSFPVPIPPLPSQQTPGAPPAEVSLP